MIDPCSAELLTAALDGKLTGAQEIELHCHLEHCESCCDAMEQLAGGANFCHRIATCLTDDPFDTTVPNRDEWSAIDFSVELLDPPDDPSLLGKLGSYDILEMIGHGGMGVVLKAFDPELKRYVAIKALSPHLSHSSLARKRFSREAQAAAAVVNPHVIAIYQVQPNGRLPYLVMPLMSGESLAQRLAERGSLEVAEILRIGTQACEGLAAAHEQGLVHRDVKPANILLEKGVERAVLTDFGLARAADDVSMTRWGVIAGTPQYMSPEQARGESLDGRSDLFSLGCVLYEMACGVSPFRADSTVATLHRVVEEQPRSLASLNPELPPWFIAIVDRLLAKDPAKRFASAREVSDLLERCLAHTQQPSIAKLPEFLDCTSNGAGSRKRWPGVLARILMGSGIGLTLLFVLTGWLSPLLSLTPVQAKAQSESNLHRLTAALIAYEQEHGHYPASSIYGKDGAGGPPHSWRVEILPYLGHKGLYDQYRMDEPWDSPHNKSVLARIPDVFRAPLADRRSTNTSYFGVFLVDAKATTQESLFVQRYADSASPTVISQDQANLKTADPVAAFKRGYPPLIEHAREQLALAEAKMQNWKKLQAAAVSTQVEGERIEIELHLARLQLAEAEGRQTLVRETLDKIVEARERSWKRAEQLQKSGAITATEVDDAENRYLEALVHRSSADSSLVEIRAVLEKIVAVKSRKLDRLKQLNSKGVVPSVESANAEAELKMAQSLSQLVASLVEVKSGTNLRRFHAEYPDRVYMLAGSWLTDTEKARCAVCHESGQLDLWKNKFIAQSRLLMKDPEGGPFHPVPKDVDVITPGEQERVARNSAANQWRSISVSVPVRLTTPEKQTLIRRMSLDLVGRLPTEGETAAFLADESSHAVDRLVNRLSSETVHLPQGATADGVFVPYGSTIFSRPVGARQVEILDGTANTISLVECKRDVPWTRPDDIEYDLSRSDSVLGGWYSDGWYAGMADGRVRFVPIHTGIAETRALLTINGSDAEGADQPQTKETSRVDPSQSGSNLKPAAVRFDAQLRGIQTSGGSSPAPERAAIPMHYSPDAEHVWNRLHAALFVRAGSDGTTYGEDRLDPLLWAYSRHLLVGKSHERAVTTLNEFLSASPERHIQAPLKRAWMQRDLWLVFDWLANETGRLNERSLNTPEVRAAREELQKLLGRAIAQVALNRDEISRLPDNYAAAIESGRLDPRLNVLENDELNMPVGMLDESAGWVCFGRTEGAGAPEHQRAIPNSVFLMFLKLPGGPETARVFLNKVSSFDQPLVLPNSDSSISRSYPNLVNLDLPQLPPGSIIVLVRRALLLDSAGQVVASPLTESVQLRKVLAPVPDLTREILDDAFLNRVAGIKRNQSWQLFRELRVSRALLFAGVAGGLRWVGDDERDFKTGFRAHLADAFESEIDGSDFVHRTQPQTIHASCTVCHVLPGVYSLNSLFDFRSGISSGTSPARQSQLAPRSAADVSEFAVKQKSRQCLPGVPMIKK